MERGSASNGSGVTRSWARCGDIQSQKISLLTYLFVQSSHALSNDTEALGKLALSLLKTPMHQMMARIEEKRFEAAKSAAEQIEQAAKSVKVDVKGKGKHVPDIWTDRYRPKSFTDLLGDEVSLGSVV